jgi:hypothetical protein
LLRSLKVPKCASMNLHFFLLAALNSQLIFPESLSIESKLKSIILDSSVGTRFLKLEGCPDLADPSGIRDSFGYKMVRRCLPSGVSILNDAVRLELGTGEILLGFDGESRVANTRAEQRAILKRIKQLKLPSAALQERLAGLKIRFGLSGNLQLNPSEAHGIYRAVLYQAIDGRIRSVYYIHALTGELFQKDRWTQVNLNLIPK